MGVRKGTSPCGRHSRPSGPAGRRWRALAASGAAGILAVAVSAPALAQSALTGWMRPSAERTGLPSGGRALNGDFGPASSQLTRSEDDGIAAASGAGETGYDSFNRKRRKPNSRTASPLKNAGEIGRGASGASAAAPPSASAHRERVAASVSGTAQGQPARRRLKPDDDPFAAVGFHAGSLLFKPAIEISAGYDNNPARTPAGSGAGYYVIAPELLIASDWSRHSLTADLRGSFTAFPGLVMPSSPQSIDRPDFTGKVVGRIDVTRDSQIDLETRLRVGTDNPGSPNIAANLSRFPVFGTIGQSIGLTQRFNRLELSASGGLDRTVFEDSHLTDGSVTSNVDRNYDQYMLTARAAYEVGPGVKPFVEVSADRRIHDVAADRSGYLRDSAGVSARAGSTFELSRLLTGEASIGYGARSYEDSRLAGLSGLLTAASLVWTVTPLTRITMSAKSSLDETTVAGVSGSLSRDYGLQVDHAFRRWLIGTAKIGTGTSDYGGARFDRRYFVEGDLLYKLSRTFHLKGQIRHDWLQSTAPGATSSATVVMLGLRVQR